PRCGPAPRRHRARPAPRSRGCRGHRRLAARRRLSASGGSSQPGRPFDGPDRRRAESGGRPGRRGSRFRRVKPPRTRYAVAGELSIAYQVFGQGPVDLVLVPGFVSHLDLTWEEPTRAAVFHRLGEFARVVVFDKRNTGLSDRTLGAPTLEERMDDIRAV